MVDPILIEALSSTESHGRLHSPSLTNENICFYLEFQDIHLSARYKIFKIGSTSTITIFLLGLLLSIIYTIYWVLVFSVKNNSFAILTFIISLILGPTILWILIGFRLFVSIEKQKRQYKLLLSYLEPFVIVGWAISLYCIIIFRVNEGKCSLKNLIYIWSCNPYYSLHGFSADTSYLFISLPLIFSTTMPFIESKILLSIHFICALALIGLVIEQVELLSVPFVSLFIIINSLILVFYRYQNMELFLLNSKYERSLEIRSIEKRINENKLCQEMSNMVTSIAHDLKSPLAAFSNGIDVMKETIKELQIGCRNLFSNSDCNIAKCLSVLDNSLWGLYGSNHLLIMIINRCTDFTKICHGIDLTPVLEPIDIREAIHRIRNCIMGLQSDVEIDLEPFDHKVSTFVITDRQWFLDNLLCIMTNAIKYSNDGVVSVRMYLTKFSSTESFEQNQPYRVEMEGRNMVRIEVENYGHGISKTDIERAFKPPNFSKQRSVGGGGLGLYCLARRIEALKGEYGIQPIELNTGTLSWFTIPHTLSQRAYTRESNVITSLNVDENVNDNSFCSHETIDTTRKLSNADHTMYNILIVDDSLPILKMLKMILEKHGHRVETALNGFEALKKLNLISSNSSEEGENVCEYVNPKMMNHSFHVILMDLQMPIMDGFEATRRIREYEKHHLAIDSYGKSQIIIAMSANNDPTSISDAYSSGINYFLPKPFSWEHFNKIMEELL